jgi:hypothetical protein
VIGKAHYGELSLVNPRGEVIDGSRLITAEVMTGWRMVVEINLVPARSRSGVLSELALEFSNRSHD